jgi:hypothetical protein
MTAAKRALVVTCAIVTLGAVLAGSAHADLTPHGTFEAATLAIPTVPGADVQAQEVHVDTAHARHAVVSGVATTSLTCDRCTGRATTLQIVYAKKATTLVAGNIATAWASGCTRCHGWALSLQVVILASARTVTAANRALALNAGCVSCTTRAAAIQIVVVGAPGRYLSGGAIARIVAQRDQLRAQLSSTAAQRVSPRTRAAAANPPDRSGTRALAATTARIQDVITADLGATGASHHLKMATG